MLTVKGPIKCLRCGYQTPAADYNKASGQMMAHLTLHHPNWQTDTVTLPPPTDWRKIAEGLAAELIKALDSLRLHRQIQQLEQPQATNIVVSGYEVFETAHAALAAYDAAVKGESK